MFSRLGRIGRAIVLLFVAAIPVVGIIVALIACVRAFAIEKMGRIVAVIALAVSIAALTGIVSAGVGFGSGGGTQADPGCTAFQNDLSQSVGNVLTDLHGRPRASSSKTASDIQPAVSELTITQNVTQSARLNNDLGTMVGDLNTLAADLNAGKYPPSDVASIDNAASTVAGDCGLTLQFG